MRYLLLLFPLLLPAQGPISGVVIDSVTGAPVPKVSLQLSALSEPTPSQRHALTGASGEFHFAEVPGSAARYLLFVKKTGYLPGFYPGPGYFALFEIPPSGLAGLKIPLVPSSALSGVLVDHNGEPLEGKTVSATKQRTIAGQTIVTFSGPHGRTNDLGEFRIAGLSSGEYVLYADYGRRLLGTHTVQTGQTLEGIKAALPPPPIGFRASGKLSFVPARYSVGVSTIGPPSRGATVEADGSFTFTDVPPGHYSLVGNSGYAGNNTCEAGSVTISNADVTGVNLTPVPRFTLRGTVRLAEGAGPLPASFTVVLSAPCAQRLEITTAADGTFTVPDFPQQRFKATVYPGAGLNLIEFRQSGQPVTTPDFAPEPFEILLDSRPAQISAQLEAATSPGGPMGVSVYLIPDLPTLPLEQIAMMNNQDPHTFPPTQRNVTLSRLLPGRYRLLAAEVPPNQGHLEEVLLLFPSLIQTITLAPGQNLEIKLPVITVAAMTAAGIELDR